MDPGVSPLASPPATRRGRFGFGALIAIAIAAAALGAGAMLLVRDHAAEEGTPPPSVDEVLYQCPMHPTITQNHSGDCPICGMKLVKMEPGGGAGAPGERRVLYYRSPMDAKQTSPTPRKDEMGMDYVPVYSDEVGGESGVAGLATVNIDPSRQQLIGLKTVEVRRGAVGGAWRTVGRVTVDETRVKHINVKIAAYVERIFVDFVGKPVAKGEPLFAIYSPELLAARRSSCSPSGLSGGSPAPRACRRMERCCSTRPAASSSFGTSHGPRSSASSTRASR